MAAVLIGPERKYDVEIPSTIRYMSLPFNKHTRTCPNPTIHVMMQSRELCFEVATQINRNRYKCSSLWDSLPIAIEQILVVVYIIKQIFEIQKLSDNFQRYWECYSFKRIHVVRNIQFSTNFVLFLAHFVLPIHIILCIHQLYFYRVSQKVQ